MKKSELVKAIMALGQGYKKKGLQSMNVAELEAILKPPEEAAPEEKAEFVSLCGHKFDPSEAATCFTMCKDDTPEAFEACLANFKTLKVAPKKKVAGAGSNQWHHQIKSQGGLIDDIFIAGQAISLEELCETVKGSPARIKSHLGHLRADWKLDIRVTEDKRYFWAETNKSEGTPIAGRTAYTGTKTRPAFLPTP